MAIDIKNVRSIEDGIAWFNENIADPNRGRHSETGVDQSVDYITL